MPNMAHERQERNQRTATVESDHSSSYLEELSSVSTSLSSHESEQAPTVKTESSGIIRFVPSQLRVGLARFIPFLGYHHVLMMICSVPILFLSLVMGGCSARGIMQNLRVVSFEHRVDSPESHYLMMNESIAETVSDWALELRNDDQTITVEGVQAGYFSLCVKLNPGSWQCGIKTIDDRILDGTSDPLGLISMAHHFRTRTISPGLIILSLLLNIATISILGTFPGWHEEEDTNGSVRDVKPFPSRAMSFFALLCSTAASFGSFIAIAWQHMAVAAAGATAEALRYGSVEVGTGTTVAVLSWMSVLFLFIVAFGLVTMIASIAVLSAMV